MGTEIGAARVCWSDMGAVMAALNESGLVPDALQMINIAPVIRCTAAPWLGIVQAIPREGCSKSIQPIGRSL
jgi:hypothetical protein